MKPWLTIIGMMVVGLFIQTSFALETNSLKLSSEGIIVIFERILCVLYIEGRATNRSLYEALQNVSTIRHLLASVDRKFHDHQHIISAIDTLITLKSQQVTRSDKTVKSITRHLQQLKDGLSLVLETDYKLLDGLSQYEVVSSETTESLATEIITNYLEQKVRPIQRASISKEGNMHPGLKRTLKTGAFVMAMLSTTADVCVLAGPFVCFALYVAGSGAMVIWFAQIYKTVLGVNSIHDQH